MAAAVTLLTLWLPAAEPVPGAPTPPPAISRYLQPGGDLYAHLNTTDWTTALNRYLMAWARAETGSAQQLAAFEQALAKLADSSGLSSLAWAGASSRRSNDGAYHNRIALQRGDGDGLLWTVFGESAEPLTGPALAPENTVAMLWTRLAPQLLWQWVHDSIAISGIDDLQGGLRELYEEARDIGIDLDALVKSLGDEVGILMTVPAAAKDKRGVIVPDIAAAVKVQNGTLWNALSTILREEGAAAGELEAGGHYLKMRSRRGGGWEFTAAAYKEFVLFGSSLDCLNAMASAAESGAGLAASEGYRKQMAGLPTDNAIGVHYAAPAFSDLLGRVLAATEDSHGRMDDEVMIMRLLVDKGDPFYSAGVLARSDIGYLLTATSNRMALKSGLTHISLPALIPMLGYTTLQAVGKPGQPGRRARATGIRCSSNLKQIGLACLMYSGEFDGAFPPNTEVLPRDGYLNAGPTWRCPARAQPVPKAMTDYTYIGAGLRDDNNQPTRTVIAYCTHHPGQLIALFADCHVQVMQGGIAQAKRSGWIFKTAPQMPIEDVPAATRKTVEQLISQLGDADRKVRRAARDQLNDMGNNALPVLQKHRNHEDVEVRMTVRELLGE
jgi:hypothetical protein